MTVPFRFIHCADLHLGAPFKYLTQVGQCGEVLREATYRAFHNLVDRALAENVDAFLISGDIYNSADHNLAAQYRFVGELERLSAKDIQVFIAHGNHDPLDAWQAKIDLPNNVHVFSGQEVEEKIISVRGKAAAIVYGMSHAVRGITENLAKRFQHNESGMYAIAVLHASVGSVEGTIPYAPCTLEDLRMKGINYWALGHIHKRQVLNEEPYVVYPGNTQGLHRREGGPKGAYLVSVNSSGHTSMNFIETNAIRFEEVHIDITSLKGTEEIEEMIRHKKEMLRNKYHSPVLLRIALEGASALSEVCRDEEVREIWLKKTQDEEIRKENFVFVYALEDKTGLAIDLDNRKALPDVVGDYLRAIDKVSKLSREERLAWLNAYIDERPEMRRLQGHRYLLDEDVLEEALQRAVREGALRLMGEKNENN